MVKLVKGLPVTIVIKNCRWGSAAWFHERRHLEQEARWSLVSLTGVAHHLLLVGLFLVAWLYPSQVFLFALLLLLNDFVLEWDAELYSLRRVGLRRWFRRSWF